MKGVRRIDDHGNTHTLHSPHDPSCALPPRPAPQMLGAMGGPSSPSAAAGLAPRLSARTHSPRPGAGAGGYTSHAQVLDLEGQAKKVGRGWPGWVRVGTREVEGFMVRVCCVCVSACDCVPVP